MTRPLIASFLAHLDAFGVVFERTADVVAAIDDPGSYPDVTLTQTAFSSWRFSVRIDGFQGDVLERGPEWTVQRTLLTQGLLADFECRFDGRGQRAAVLLRILEFTAGIRILIRTAAQNNVVGGSTPGERNIITYNNGNGISVREARAVNNVIQNNWIGIDDTRAAAANAGEGVLITDGASFNLIGGTGANDGNIIAEGR